MQQVRTGMVCGKTHRGGAVPSVKAYVGVLPDGQRGIEFHTEIPPLRGTAPHLALWRRGSPGVNVGPNDDVVCIPVTISMNTPAWP